MGAKGRAAWGQEPPHNRNKNARPSGGMNSVSPGTFVFHNKGREVWKSTFQQGKKNEIFFFPVPLARQE